MSMGQAKLPDSLTEARRLYNAQKFDEAITRAAEAELSAPQAQAARVVLARARLERFRLSSDAGDLTEARTVIRRIDASKLAPRDEVEYVVALGELFFLDDQSAFDDRYSAAAEQFEIALGRTELLDAASRDLLFEWWALSLDHQAQLGPEFGRRSVYERIVARAEGELARDTRAASAAYWLAAGACGMDDFSRAWGAAVAAWVRAGSLGPRGATLRDDLDRLVMHMVLPERARQLAAGADARPALQSLQTQWTQIKEMWK